jgi:O-antigen/teichoic acid export membrane protein
MERTKTKKINLPATASLWYIASSLIARGSSFFTTPLLTRMLGAEEYGIYSLYTGVLSIFTVITTLELSGSIMYRGFAKFKSSHKEFICSALGMQLLLSLIFSTVYIIFRSQINAITGITTPLTLILLAQIFLNSAQSLYFCDMRYSYKYKTVAGINIISGISAPLLSLFLIRLGMGGKARIAAPFIISMVFVIPIILKIIKDGKVFFSKRVWKFLLAFAIPMLPHYLSLSLIAQSDRIIIARLMGDAAVGKYSVAHALGSVITVITGGLSLGITPWIIRKLEGGSLERVRELFNTGVVLIASGSLFFLAAVPELFAFIAPTEYADALPAVYPITLSVTPAFISGLLTSCLMHFEKPGAITKNSVAAAFTSIVLCLFLTERLGYIGSGFALLISQSVLFILNYATFKKLSGSPIGNSKKLLLCFLMLYIFSPLLYLFRTSPLSRILITAAMLMLCLPDILQCKRLLLER